MIDLLEEQVEAVRAEQGAGALEKARAIGFLAGVALRAIEAGNLSTDLRLPPTNNARTAWRVVVRLDRSMAAVPEV